MRKRLALVAAVYMAAAGCAGFLGGGAQPTTVLVDFSHDEFASFFVRYFPDRVTVRQGDELVFKQTWTGEPHTVTGGTLADKVGKVMAPYFENIRKGEPLPQDEPKDVAEATEKVGSAFGEEDSFNQTMAQPCYTGAKDTRKEAKPCENQEQPLFNGKQAIYNSGIIPYEGAQGNEYRVNLSEDIEPATYFFYCVVHGSLQGTEVVVKSKDADVPSPAEVGRQARQEIDKLAAPLRKIFEDAKQDNKVTLKDPESGDRITIEGNFAGLFAPELFPVWHGINEFVPKRITAKVGEKITWNLLNFHTITFGVPEYFPIITFEKDGNVKRNSKLDPHAGGAKEFDPPEEERYKEGSLEPVKFDGGTYDGTGFWSSGTMDAEPYLEYSMTITRPGTYKYACLVHPPMVGTVEVTA